MKKFFSIILLMVSMLIVTSCSSDVNGGLSGWYLTKMYSGTCAGLHFKNGKTVEYYSNLMNQKDGNDYKGTVKISGTTYYYYYSPSTYSYTVSDNKVIIPGKGDILIKSGNALTSEASQVTYYKK